METKTGKICGEVPKAAPPRKAEPKVGTPKAELQKTVVVQTPQVQAAPKVAAGRTFFFKKEKNVSQDLGFVIDVMMMMRMRMRTQFQLCRRSLRLKMTDFRSFSFLRL